MHCRLRKFLGFPLIFLPLLLSACIVLPIPALTEKTYKNELLSAIQPGQSNRDGVIQVLGEADVTRENDSIWIYSASRVAVWIVAAVGYGGSGGGGIEPIYDYQHVVVEFENEIVVHVELVEDESGCTSTGICMRKRKDDIYYVSKGDLDQKAKEFQGIVGQCSLYIYAPGGWNRFSLDSFRNVEINSDHYLRVYLQLGSHSFRTFSPSGEIQEEIIECAQGEQLFLKLSGVGWMAQRNYSVRFVTDDIGRQAISERNLYLSP